MVSFTQMTVPYNSLEIFGTRGSIFENHAWERPVRLCSFDERMGKIAEVVEPEVEHAPSRSTTPSPLGKRMSTSPGASWKTGNPSSRRPNP